MFTRGWFMVDTRSSVSERVLWHNYAEATAVDHSGHHNDGTLRGPVFVAGQDAASALSFDGVDDRVVVGPSRSLQSIRALRIDVEMRLDELGGRRTIVEAYNAFSLLVEPDGILEGTIYNGKRWEGVRSRPHLLDLGSWAHVTFCYDGVDAALLGVGAETVIACTRPLGPMRGVEWPFGLNIGAWPNADRRVFKGLISAVSIWDLGTPGLC